MLAGTKGKRYALPNATIHMHQPLGGAQGQASDIEIQAREILDGRGNKDDVARALGVHPFVAEKTTGQAGRFSMEALEGIYHRLLKIDEQVKTSQVTLDLALDTLVVELAR